jgi:hypothetical protein
VIAESAGVGPAGNKAYGFWAFSTTTGTGFPHTALVQDPLAVDSYPVLTGTRLVPITGEADPCIYGTNSDADSWKWSAITGSWDNNITPFAQAWFAFGYGGSGFVRMSGDGGDYASALAPSKFGTGAHGFDVGLPAQIGRHSGQLTEVGYKGSVVGVKRAGTLRSYPNTVDLSAGAYVYIDDSLIPWEDGTVPLL